MSDNQKTLLASELLEKLRAKIDEHGDRPVYLDDPDTGRLLGIKLEMGDQANWGLQANFGLTDDCFLITVEYDSKEGGNTEQTLAYLKANPHEKFGTE